MHVLEKLIAYGALPITVSGNFLFVFFLYIFIPTELHYGIYTY